MESKKLIMAASLAAGLSASPLVLAEANPFQSDKLSSGYANQEGRMQLAEGKTADGKCGAGKCGAEKKTDGKCGAGKCGADKTDTNSDTDKKADGKCGAGKCGAEKSHSE